MSGTIAGGKKQPRLIWKSMAKTSTKILAGVEAQRSVRKDLLVTMS